MTNVPTPEARFFVGRRMPTSGSAAAFRVLASIASLVSLAAICGDATTCGGGILCAAEWPAAIEQRLEKHCYDCHGPTAKEGGLD
ncbi:MAG TPA: hypothetical protein PLV92_23990, partial [Pirellulaceae bacterium]|nr:hypothetical protein [Pirellulaceae bacterium]